MQCRCQSNLGYLLQKEVVFYSPWQIQHLQWEWWRILSFPPIFSLNSCWGCCTLPWGRHLHMLVTENCTVGILTQTCPDNWPTLWAWQYGPTLARSSRISGVLCLASLWYLREAFKKNHFIIDICQNSFDPPPKYWRETIDVWEAGRGGDPLFIKVKITL